MSQQLGHELLKHLALSQPLAVLGERGRVPDRVIGRQPNEPAEQQVVVQLLDQLPLGADAVEHLQQQGAQQLLRRNRWTAFTRIQPAEALAQPFQHVANQVAHLAQRMLGRHARLRRNVREQGALITKFAAHCLPPRLRPWLNHSVPLRDKEFFSRLLDCCHR
jgi:hypothetical protein